MQDPNTPIGLGWLRASHRKLDRDKTLAHRPYHTHDELQTLTSGHVYELDVEIWPTCIVVPVGYRLALSVKGKDYETSREVPAWAKGWSYAGRGVPPNFTHADPDDRPTAVFGGTVTLHAGGSTSSFLLLPIIPPKAEGDASQLSSHVSRDPSRGRDDDRVEVQLQQFFVIGGDSRRAGRRANLFGDLGAHLGDVHVFDDGMPCARVWTNRSDPTGPNHGDIESFHAAPMLSGSSRCHRGRR